MFFPFNIIIIYILIIPDRIDRVSVGRFGNNHHYGGHSGVYDVLGHKIDTLKHELENVALVTLKKEHIQSSRDTLRFLDDGDVFEITN
ncbi:hypothetical protein [Paucihalobacter sp.]|uniref:hypothetical protein n=1 Tax=Paucihalobacter sp. TaxID=2850405 RepID=UPI002FE32A81